MVLSSFALDLSLTFVTSLFRASIDVVTVIDRSGSLASSQKMELVKETLQLDSLFAISKLKIASARPIVSADIVTNIIKQPLSFTTSTLRRRCL